MIAFLLANWKPIGLCLLVLLALGGSAGVGYHYGGLSSQVQLLQAQEKSEAADASQAHQALLLTQTAMAKQQETVDEYDRVKDLPDPISAGILTRVQVLASACPLLSAAASPSGAPAAAGKPVGEPAATRLSELAAAAASACDRDAARLQTLIQLERTP